MGNNTLEIDDTQIRDIIEELRLKPNERKIDVILVGEPGGKTYYSMNIGFGEMSVYPSGIHFEQPLIQPGFPGKTIVDALPQLEKEYDRVLIFAASYSGDKKTVSKDMEELDKHLENNRHDKVKLIFATGHPETNTSKIVKRRDGIILRLEGLKEGMDEDNYIKYGILGDAPECELAVALQGITEINHKNLEPSEFKPIVEKRLRSIGRKIDETVPLPFFQKLPLDVVSSSNLFLGGYAGLARTVSEAADIRYHQVKGLVPRGGAAQVMGEPGTNPTSPGDSGLWTSYSGDPTYTIDWCNLLQERGGRSYSIIGHHKTKLEDCTPKDNSLIITDEVKSERPTWFYVNSYIVHTALANRAIQTGEKLKIFKYTAQKMKEQHHIG